MPSQEVLDAYQQREALWNTAYQSECAQCSWQMCIKVRDGVEVIACPRDNSHQGYRRLRSLTQLAREGVYIPYVSERLERKEDEEMERAIEERGAAGDESRALAIYGERFPITQEAATKIVDLFYGDKTIQARVEMVILCTQHNLNPLPSRKQVYIVTYKGVDAVILGIESHRIMARRKSPYSYVGDRLLSTEDVEARGEQVGNKIWVEVSLEIPGGRILRGVSNFSKTGMLIGEEQGNTRYDMACKRAEAKALARILPPEDLPAPLGLVIDGVYADVTEIIEQPRLPAAAPARPRQASPEGRGVQAPAKTDRSPAEAPGESPNRESTFDSTAFWRLALKLGYRSDDVFAALGLADGPALAKMGYEVAIGKLQALKRGPVPAAEAAIGDTEEVES